VKIHIRVDDVPYGTPQDKAGYDWYLMSQKLCLMDSFGFPYMLGIVLFPAITDSGLLSLLSSLKNAVKCLHGFDHGLQRWRPNDSAGGEFEGLTTYACEHHLRVAQADIAGLSKIFIPPFNVFTQDLLDALNRTWFKYITTGPETRRENLHLLNYGDLKVCHAGRWYDSIKEATQNIDKVCDGETISFHLPWVSLKQIQNLFTAIKQKGIEVTAYDS
jgi:hypothetical protein